MGILNDRIVGLRTYDIRFPTSESLYGSDATNKDPDYSAASIEIETAEGKCGHALIFTIGRGNNLCCAAVENMRHLILGWKLEDIKADMAAFYDHLRSDSQLRWLGPETGVVHMAMGGIVNAVWDLWARSAGKPVWRLLTDMPPEQFVSCLDFRYVTDVLTKEEALDIVCRNESTKNQRIRDLERHGYPAYTTAPGWLGYGEEKLRRLCEDARSSGFRHVKLKVGEDIENDHRRCSIAREALGEDVKLMVDANQAWEVEQAIDWTRRLQSVSPWFIEEPTSPDDILGHKTIREALSATGIKVATGEHCQNRVIFKQLIAADAIDIVQIDACRLAGLNEALTVFMIAAKYGKPVCPHAGGVGLCEYVQHLSMIDYTRISAEIGERVIEYVDHLHEHFEDPCIVKNGAYMAPSKPGYSIKMHASALRDYRFPDGAEWRRRLAAQSVQRSGG